MQSPDNYRDNMDLPHNTESYVIYVNESVSHVLFPEESEEELKRFIHMKSKEMAMSIILNLYLKQRGYRRSKVRLASLQRDVYKGVDSTLWVNGITFPIDFTTNDAKKGKGVHRSIIIHMDHDYIYGVLRALRYTDGFESLPEAREWLQEYTNKNGFPRIIFKSFYESHGNLHTFLKHYFHKRSNL